MKLEHVNFHFSHAGKEYRVTFHPGQVDVYRLDESSDTLLGGVENKHQRNWGPQYRACQTHAATLLRQVLAKQSASNQSLTG